MTYIEDLLLMTYDECVESLFKKYGIVPNNYFNDKECTNVNHAIKRGKEGLFIHHIDEDKAIMLSTPKYAINNTFDFQKADRLVYCNLLEHLVLHIKIVEYPNPDKDPNVECGTGGICNFLVPELNDIYSGISYSQDWKKKVIENIISLKGDYLKCIKKLVDLDFKHPLLKSFNERFCLWKDDYNKKIYEELRNIGVKI